MKIIWYCISGRLTARFGWRPGHEGSKLVVCDSSPHNGIDTLAVWCGRGQIQYIMTAAWHNVGPALPFVSIAEEMSHGAESAFSVAIPSGCGVES